MDPLGRTTGKSMKKHPRFTQSLFLPSGLSWTGRNGMGSIFGLAGMGVRTHDSATSRRLAYPPRALEASKFSANA
jgi:hypothetical protein